MTTKTGKADAHTGNDYPDSLEAVRVDFLGAPSRHCDAFVRAFHEAEYQEAVRLTDDIADYRGEHANLLPSEVEIQKRRVDEAEARLGTIISELKSNAAGAEREVRGREQQGAGKELSKEDAKDKSDLEAHIRVLMKMIDEIMRRWEKARSSESLQKTSTSPADAVMVAGSTSDAVGWTVRRPERFTPYSQPLFSFLSAAHREGRPRPPTARDVLEAWRVNPPAEVAKVLTDSFDYYDSNGNIKAADLKALSQAIKRMTSAR